MEGWTTKDVADKYSIPRSVALCIRSGECYFHVRSLYDIPVKSREDFSESTIRWICEEVLKGCSDSGIAKSSSNKRLSPALVKKVRYKIRYKSISDEYF